MMTDLAKRVWREADSAGEMAYALARHAGKPDEVATAAGNEAAALVIDRALRPATMPGDVVEELGEALFGLSARLLLSGFLDDDANHAAYEKVVAEFGRPFITFPNPETSSAALTAMHPAIQAAVDALEGVLPFLEDAETKRLVSDEGCVWAVENVRHSLATLRTVTEQGEG